MNGQQLTTVVKRLTVATEEVDVNLLKQHPRNVNQGDLGAVISSIETNGFYGRLIVNRRNNHVLAGNHRLMAAKSLKMPTVPVEWVDVDEDSEIRILLADNRTTRLGLDDNIALTALLAELANTEKQLQGTGYDYDDLNTFISDMAQEELRLTSEPYENPVPRLTNEGETWELGSTLLVVGENETDCDKLIVTWEKQTKGKAVLRNG